MTSLLLLLLLRSKLSIHSSDSRSHKQHFFWNSIEGKEIGSVVCKVERKVLHSSVTFYFLCSGKRYVALAQCCGGEAALSRPGAFGSVRKVVIPVV